MLQDHQMYLVFSVIVLLLIYDHLKTPNLVETKFYTHEK